MRYLTIIFCAVLVLFSSPVAQSKTIHVPGDSSTIQAGINGAAGGDTVLVATGSYPETINFLGKSILVASNYIFNPCSSVIESTVIWGLGPKVTFDSGEDSTSAIKGFTILGFATPYPGNRGIVCRNSSPRILNNVIKENTVAVYVYEVGAGIYCDNSHPLISQNVIKDNVACWGAGIYLTNSSNPVIEENLIEYNYTASGMFVGSGAGIGSYGDSSPVIRNNLIRRNWVDMGDGGGISCDSAIISNNIILRNAADYGSGVSCGSAVVTNNTIWDNPGGEGIACGSGVITNNIIANQTGAGIHCDLGSTPLITYNNVWNNAGGNFSSCDANLGVLDTVNLNGDSCDVFFNISYDPLFDDTLYHLSPASPCMEAGCNTAQGLFGFDFDGEPRVMDGDSNGVAIVDMGADEFPGEPPLCGNVNGDGVVNIADVVYLINYLFIGGPPPDPLSLADVNLDSVVNIADVVYLINYLFIGGPPPCEP